jgi:hypothetical protein
MEWKTSGWIYVIIIFVVIIIVIWLVAGGKNYEFVGVNPLLEIDDINLSYRNSYALSRVCSSSKFERSMSFKQLSELSRINRERDELLSASAEELKKICANKPKNVSKGEAYAKIIIEEIYGTRFEKIRPSWLQNPETGANLELDLFSDNVVVNGVRYSVAIEYNGAQHYIFPNHFCKNEEQFKNQIKRDIYKREICDLNDVFLITVPYYIANDKMKQYIIENIPDVMLPSRYKR